MLFNRYAMLHNFERLFPITLLPTKISVLSNDVRAEEHCSFDRNSAEDWKTSHGTFRDCEYWAFLFAFQT